MDKILVTLLLVVIAITALVGIESWFNTHRDDLIDKANTQINITLS